MAVFQGGGSTALLGANWAAFPYPPGRLRTRAWRTGVQLFERCLSFLFPLPLLPLCFYDASIASRTGKDNMRFVFFEHGKATDAST